jgi:ubiquinone/menaquinone biosynthesis C-methylase UbiE
MPAGYRTLPAIYDRWQKTYGRDYSTIILPRLLRTIVRHKIPGSFMLDVASGTGSLAFMMAGRGWKVWGVDASELMVAESMRKLVRKRAAVLFLHQDMREIRVPQKVSLATSMFDSLNHLTTRQDLLRTFRGVARSLQPGGYFVFDMNNERCFRRLWIRTETVDHPDFTLILKNRYDRRTRHAYSFVTLFKKDGKGYSRSGEIVKERYFPRSEVRTALARAGFRILECEDFNFTDVPEIGKIKTWWVARKSRSASSGLHHR